MPLIDCFIELIAYVSYFLKTVPKEQPSFEQIKTDIHHLIGKSHDNFHQSDLPQEDFDLARFAVFTWVDEVILSSDWHKKSEWQGEQLQRVYYHTTDAGEIFFDKLNNLEPPQTQVREVYYLCLALGFTGRYCNPGDEYLLEQLKNSNLKLVEGSKNFESIEQTLLFPKGYQLDETIQSNDKGKGGIPISLVFGISLPVLLYGVLFFVYRFVLHNVGENFISLVQ